MQFPNWVTDPTLDACEQCAMRLRYYVYLAALHHNSEGSVQILAKAAGFTPTAVYQTLNKGFMTPGMAAAIESAVGRFVTKEDLCPRKFAAL